MAEKQDYTQSELFTQSQDSGNYKPFAPKNSFFLRIREYEKVILLIMGIVLVSIISYSTGIENGKRVSLTNNNSFAGSSFTIQVAAFRNRQLALHHAQLLTKSGLSPMAFAKGDYIILCVGKFTDQESAQPMLIKLQRTYAGSRIRRL